jgi:hypothetical protein
MMKNDGIPCCAADAIRSVKQVEVNGATVGLSMLDLVFAEVQELGLADDTAVQEELIRRVRVYNYVPHSAAGCYAAAVYREYVKWNEGGRR